MFIPLDYLHVMSLRLKQFLVLSAIFCLVPIAGTANMDHESLAGSQFMTDTSIWMGFDTPARYFSFYYWNDNPLANYGDIQRVLLGGLAVNESP